jgi:hypothetical protein
MSQHIFLLEFETVDGTTLLQRLDHITSILESTLPVKDGPPRKVLYLLLANNNRIQVVGETRDSIIKRMRDAQGLPVIIQERPE